MVNSEAEPVSVTVDRCQIVDIEVHRHRSRNGGVGVPGAFPAEKHSATAAFWLYRRLTANAEEVDKSLTNFKVVNFSQLGI